MNAWSDEEIKRIRNELDVEIEAKDILEKRIEEKKTLLIELQVINEALSEGSKRTLREIPGK